MHTKSNYTEAFIKHARSKIKQIFTLMTRLHMRSDFCLGKLTRFHKAFQINKRNAKAVNQIEALRIVHYFKYERRKLSDPSLSEIDLLINIQRLK